MKEERPGKSKSDTRGHPASSKMWTAKSVCSYLFTARISDEQKLLSDGGEKDIGKYRAALANVFDNLTSVKRKSSGARRSQSSGIQCHFQMIFNTSKLF